MADVDDPGGSSENSAEQSKREGSRSRSDLLRGVVALSLTALLIQACTSGDVAAGVNLVTERHAPASEQDEESGLTPLVAACEAGHMEVVKYLIEREGVDPEQAARDGTTPLHAAARGGHVEVVQYLIDEKRVNHNSTDKNGFTPLDCAKNNRVRKSLVSHGACGSKSKRPRRQKATIPAPQPSPSQGPTIPASQPSPFLTTTADSIVRKV